MPTLAEQIAPQPKKPEGLGGWLSSIADEAMGAFERYGRRSGAQRDASLALLNQASAPGTDPIMGAGQKLLGLAGLVTHPLAFFPTGDEWRERLRNSGNDGQLGQAIGGMLGDLPSLIDPHLVAGGAATVAPAIFAGMAAKTADLNKLKQAEKLAELGHSADDIRDMTGWFKGADDKWRFEIDDSKAYYDPPGPDETFVNSKGLKHLPTDNILSHPELFKAYPDLAEMRAYLMPRKEGSPVAGYSDKSDFIALSDNFGPEDGKRSILHELQHAVQRREGFARGGRYDNPNYNELAGEVEARNVANRANMTPDQRNDLAPWLSQDVPVDQQVLSFATGASHSTPLASKIMNKADDVTPRREIVTQSYKDHFEDGSSRWVPGTLRSNPTSVPRFDSSMSLADIKRYVEQFGEPPPARARNEIVTQSYKEVLPDGTVRFAPGTYRAKRPPEQKK